MRPFSGADFSNADLSDTSFELSKFLHANFSGSDLFNAYFHGAELHGVNLSELSLQRVNFIWTDLSNADLSGSNLFKANFNGAYLENTNFDRCTLGFTTFSALDLSNSIGLNNTFHRKPSSIGLDTVSLSAGKIPQSFLRGVGVNESLIKYIQSLRSVSSNFYSCFISYSHADKTFARMLYDQLQKKGIRCWLDEHQMLPGDDIYESVDLGIRQWDKVLLCCSKSSLTSWWVDDEIGKAFRKERQLMRERGKKVLVLIPMDLDGFLFTDKWQSGKKSQILERLAADFTDWETDNKKFKEQIERVVQALRINHNNIQSAPEAKL